MLNCRKLFYRGDHTETIEVTYRLDEASYESLLSLFWNNHDPFVKRTRQYMSAIFYTNDLQKKLAEDSLKHFADEFKRPILTSVVKLLDFYEAELYHQKYFLQQHPNICNALGLEPGPLFVNSCITSRINGYIAGLGNMEEFDKEWQDWGITEKLAQKIKKSVINTARAVC